jgi:hypothetical protein
MCDFSKKLIARMDGELPEPEAAELERHLGVCAECRSRLAAYARASGAFNAYCEATLAAEMGHKRPRWLPAAVAAGIAAAVVIGALLTMPRLRVAKLPARVVAVSEAPHVVGQPAEPMVTAAKPPDAGHRVSGAIHRASRQHVAAVAAGAGGANVERETASAAPAPSFQARNVRPFPSEPPIEIAIPAAAMFPPGAVPPGMSFAAELTIAADGSPEQLGLRPRLAGFEGRKNQP